MSPTLLSSAGLHILLLKMCDFAFKLPGGDDEWVGHWKEWRGIDAFLTRNKGALALVELLGILWRISFNN